MSKKFMFLVPLILVLGLVGVVQADAIKITNHSFELAPDGNRVEGHTGYDNVMAWKENYPSGGDTLGYVGVDVQCPYAGGDDPLHCHRWPGPTDDGYGSDVVYSYLQHTEEGANAYQVLDMNNSDVNAIIITGRKYKLTYDALGWNGDEHAGSLFYVEEVCQPDVNHHELVSRTYALEYIERSLDDCNGESNLDDLDECPDWRRDLTVMFVAETGAECIGRTLGIKVTALEPGSYSFVDNFRLEWSWASSAYSPDPPDGSVDVPVDVNLSWSPGLWAASHEVYFGTSESEVADANTNTPGIYRGGGSVVGPDGNDRFSYAVPETLDLGTMYYWRIDEVNENWVSGPVPPVNDRWKGDVWSFRSTGFALNVYPPDNGIGIPALELVLRWAAGTGSEFHDVYFGTSETEVADANTSSDPNIYRGRQALSEVSYPVEDLLVREDFFWRIDEVNTLTGTFVGGDVWRFRTGIYLVVDSFEFYEDTAAIRAVWKDFWSDPPSENGASVFVETDPNFTRNSDQSMKYDFKNFDTVQGVLVGSWAEAAATDLEFATNDWTAGGVKAMVMYFIGDPCNGKDTTWVYNNVCQDQMYVALADGSTNEGVVEYDGDMNGIKEDWWHEWNIDMQDFNAAGVVLTDVSKVYLGFGGPRIGQKKAGAGKVWGYADTVYFEDIRLYPPRCMPEITGLDVLSSLGDITGWDESGAQDCNTNYLDLAVMARDWNMRGIWALATIPDINAVVEYLFNDGEGSTVVANTGDLGDPYDLLIGYRYDGNDLLIYEPNNDPCWLLDPDANRGWTLSFDGHKGRIGAEKWDPAKEPVPECLGGDYLFIPPLNLNVDTVTIGAWVNPHPHLLDAKKDIWGQEGSFTGLVHTRDANTVGGLSYASGSGFTYDGTLGYVWNDNASNTWSFETDIYIPDKKWSYLAVVIEPTKATCYIGDPNGALRAAVNPIAHDAEEVDGYTVVAGDGGVLNATGEYDRLFSGQMDDVRIYDVALSPGYIAGLAEIKGIVYVALSSPADLVVGDQEPNDPNAPIDDQIDLADYAALAKHWREQHPWP